jgi:hypothetical protein
MIMRSKGVPVMHGECEESERVFGCERNDCQREIAFGFLEIGGGQGEFAGRVLDGYLRQRCGADKPPGLRSRQKCADLFRQRLTEIRPDYTCVPRRTTATDSARRSACRFLLLSPGPPGECR